MRYLYTWMKDPGFLLAADAINLDVRTRDGPLVAATRNSEHGVARVSQNAARAARKRAERSGIVSGVAANCLLQFRFEVIFICCLSVATSFGATAEPGRIVIPAKSSMQTVSGGLQKLSGRNGFLYIPTDHAEPLP